MSRTRRVETTQQVAVRFQESLLSRIDGYVDKLKKKQPGVSFTRADAMRLLCSRALDDVDAEEAAAKKRPRVSSEPGA